MAVFESKITIDCCTVTVKRYIIYGLYYTIIELNNHYISVTRKQKLFFYVDSARTA